MALPGPPGKGTAGLTAGSMALGCLAWPMPLAEMPQDLALMLVMGSRATWLGPVDRTGAVEDRALVPKAHSLKPKALVIA